MRILFLLFQLIIITVAFANPPKVFEYKLDNGLKLLVQPDNKAPVVVSQIWYKTGSSYETSGTTGLAHVLEHMMFKGTKTLKAGEFSEIIAEHGGRENAFTSKDYTAYFQRLEKSHLEICFRLEADRMQNLVLTEADFAKEIEVVKEERRLRTDDKPKSLTYEYFMATAYINSPYHHPIIGWMDDINHITVADAKNWYQQWYAPNNAILIVVGDVQPEAVYKLAQKYFAQIPARPIIPPKPQNEVKQYGERRILVKQVAKLPYFMMGYKVPALKQAETESDAYALQVLSSILDGGDSARLSRNLVRGQQLASAVSADYSLYSRRPTLFTLSAIPTKTTSMTQLEQALKQQVQQLQQSLVSDQELDLVKAQVIANAIYAQDSMFYQAMQMGILESIGLPWKTAHEYVDNIQKITPEQLQQVAQKYLRADHLTIAILQPQTIQ